MPHPSRHPVLAAARLAASCSARWPAGSTAHGWGRSSTLLGMLVVLVVLWHWFGDAIAESEGGMYGKRVDVSFRWSMSWFIFSEVMFFGAFFGALFYARADHDAMARRPRSQADLAGFHGGVAGNTGPGRRHVVEPFSDDGAVAAADHQHRAAAVLGRDADHRAPCAARRPSQQGDLWLVRDHRCSAPSSCASRATNTSMRTTN